MSTENKEDSQESTQSIQTPPPKRRGRPPKALIEKKKKPGKPGRPAGDAAAIKEYKARLLASPKSRRVLDAILNAALDDEHKNQAAAWKLVMDRLLPVGAFEQDVVKGSGRNQIQINITGIGGDVNVSEDDGTEILEGEYNESK
jgi:hypothetical protein